MMPTSWIARNRVSGLPSVPACSASRSWIARLHSRGSGVPYGVAMALAALLVFPHTRWMTALF